MNSSQLNHILNTSSTHQMLYNCLITLTTQFIRFDKTKITLSNMCKQQPDNYSLRKEYKSYVIRSSQI